MIRPYIKKGVKGKAVPIVYVSEGSHVDRAIFNCIAHIMFDRPLESAEEIDKVFNHQMGIEKQISAFLKTFKESVVGYPDKCYRLVEDDGSQG